MQQNDFTPRQGDVLREMCLGKSNKEIARALGIAEATVKLHLTEIFKTLGVKTRSQAIIKAGDLTATPITDAEILKIFVDTVFDTLGGTLSDRILQFGHAISKKAYGKSPTF